jgi:hypothetical protein
MGALSTILGWLAPNLVETLLAPLTTIFTAYVKKEITEAELKEKLTEALLSAFKEVEVAHADALAKTYASFMSAMAQNVMMQRIWSAVVLSQLGVLLWHQLGIPAIVALGIIDRYPSSGSTVEWAYALIAACLGFGPMLLRAGPGASASVVTSLKGLIGK